MLLIPTFLLLIFPINFTTYLHKYTKHSATIILLFIASVKYLESLLF